MSPHVDFHARVREQEGGHQRKFRWPSQGEVRVYLCRLKNSLRYDRSRMVGKGGTGWESKEMGTRVIDGEGRWVAYGTGRMDIWNKKPLGREGR